jgi:hypothetical protein
MKKNNNEKKPASDDRMLHALVKWFDGGVIHRGTVLRIFTRQGIRYLEVMSIFGKRHIVKASRAKFINFNKEVHLFADSDE